MKIQPVVYVVIVIAIILLAALWLMFKPKQPNVAPTPATIELNQGTSSASTQEGTKTFELVIKGKKLVSGPETIQVKEGDNVIIKITADEDEEFHLHGYDKSVDLQKDVPAELSFTANLTGRFAYELEKSKVKIGALEVLPK